MNRQQSRTYFLAVMGSVTASRVGTHIMAAVQSVSRQQIGNIIGGSGGISTGTVSSSDYKSWSDRPVKMKVCVVAHNE